MLSSARTSFNRDSPIDLTDGPALGTKEEEVFAMSEREEKGGQVKPTASSGTTESEATDPCADIKDPIRRGLCRVCQMPVAGEAPFCKDHEPPVP
jgi:hypothetical protein